MRKLYLSFLFLIVLLCGKISFAQMVGTQIYLPGHWLEIGQNNYGAFGANPPPAGYHPFPGGSFLAETYDYGHDGWTVGAPPLMGDYTYPGSPYEGWGIQINGAGGLNWAFSSSGSIIGPGSLTGANTTYVNGGGKLLANWAGTAAAGQLKINMETRVDTNASWVVVTSKFYNIGATTLNDIYYFRGCDPDNDEAHGGSFATRNVVNYQNDVDHRVGVSGVGETYTYAYLQLCTKDCRAKALVHTSWPINFYVTDLSTVYTGTAAIAPDYTVGTYDNGDIAIGLVYSLGNLCAGDSTFISYAYTFLNTPVGIDSAFPEPTIVVNGVPVNPPTAPGAIYDTFNTCLYPGMTVFPVDLTSAGSGVWTWSTWTWSPGTGLATTTGLVNTIAVNTLPPSITYTITGTAYSNCGGPVSGLCGTRTIYLTVLTCNGAVCNSPCLGDPLIFNAPGDSTGATYVWYGPAPSTAIVSTSQTFTISPSVWGDTGTYHVVKTVGLTHDTASVIAVIHPKPNVTASSNSPLCAGATNTLTLFSVTDIAVASYSWTGPSFFTSGIQNPTIAGFPAADTGTYTVIVATTFGCKDTATTHVVLLPPPGPPVITGHNPYCQGDAFIPFSITPAPGATVYWYPSPAGGTGVTTAPVVNTAVPGTYTYYYGQTIGLCESPIDSITIVVNPIPSPITGLADVCQFQSIALTDGTPGGAWLSSAPTIATVGAATGIVTGVTAGVATITYKLPTTCYVTKLVNVHAKPAKPGVTPPTYCQFTFAAPLTATPATGLLWYGPGVTAGTPLAPTPSTALPGVTSYYVTETSSFGCVSDSAIDPVTIIAQPAPPLTSDTMYCQNSQTVPLNYQVDSSLASHLSWYTSASGPAGGASLGYTPVPPSNVVTYPGGTTWYVTQTVNGCESNTAPVKVTIIDLPNFTITANKTWVCDHDSLTFSYNGSVLVSGTYYWILPPGATPIDGTTVTDPTIIVRFDSVYGPHILTLAATELGRCTTYDTISVRVIAPPTSHCHMTPDICLGDTVGLALSDKSSDAVVFTWNIDGTPLFSSTEVNLVAANSNSGGPFSISWNTIGKHIISIECSTIEGCRSDPTFDTVNVHDLPDASFGVKPKSSGVLCLEDSIWFSAHLHDANCSYTWEPEHCFNENNKPDIWGKVEQGRTDIWLTVVDAFGCKAKWDMQLSPDACCTVLFPNAFTPNGDGLNDKFRPIFNGYHNFHSFRVVNRWGQTIFESANSNPEWDGSFNGVPQDLGIYYYYIKYDCGGNTIEQKGDCTLVR